MKTAYATLKGFEVMRIWTDLRKDNGEVRLVNEQFGIYAI
jgi:hypothetical protein